MGGCPRFSCSLGLDALAFLCNAPSPRDITVTAPSGLGDLAEAGPALLQLAGHRFLRHFCSQTARWGLASAINNICNKRIFLLLGFSL